MASEESMSMCSTSSGMMSEYSQAEGFNKLETIGFSIFTPLYNQPKHPNRKWEIFFICFLDGTSLGYVAGSAVSIVAMAFLSYFILLVAYLLLVVGFQGAIAKSQPWIISLLRWLVNFTYTILFIPFISLCISTFDCYESEGQMVHRGYDSTSVIKLLPLLGFSVAIVVLTYLLITSFLINNMIYNHNPKHGGFWSSPSGLWQAVDSSLVFGCVFAMRMLIGWPFWRGVVTVGTSLAVVIYFVYIQPIYKLSGNLLLASKWCLFGCLRLFDEIGYAIEGSTGNWIITIVLQVVGLVVGILLCALLLPKLGKMFRKKKYLLNAFEHQLSDICTKNPSLALPQMKNPERVEPSLRFIQEKDYRSMIHLTFADYVYTHALKTNMNNSMLCFQYASFLSAYRKNYMKANTLIQKARTLSPGTFLNFVLFCKAKENEGHVGSGHGNGGGKNGAGDLNSFAFTTLLAKAEKHHELAVSAMKDFFENVTAIHPDYKSVPVLLDAIVQNEEVARSSYEELIASHGQSTAVLRSYARLLLDIYNDEDEADMILNRADLIEEETATSVKPLVHSHAAELPEVSLGFGEAEEAGSGGGGGGERKMEVARRVNVIATGDEKGSGSDGGAGDANNNSRSPSRMSFEISARSGEEGKEGKSPVSASAYDVRNYDGEHEHDQEHEQEQQNQIHQRQLSRSEDRWHQSTSDLKSVQRSERRRRRKKKKKEAMIVDLVMGKRGEKGNSQSSITGLKIAIILLHFINIGVLIAALVVYDTISSTYQNNLDTLRNVCDLSYYTARSAAIGYNFFVYDKKYNFSDPHSDDDWPSGMIQKVDLMNMIKETSEELATMLAEIHQSTSNMDVWETADISTYLFTIITKDETHPDGTVEEVIDSKLQTLHSSSMLQVIATVSQMMHHLFLSNISSRPQDPEYLSNIQYLVFNCPVPILDGAKRVIIYYFEVLNEECNQIMSVFTIIIAACLAPLTLIQLIIFVIFTRKSVKNRMKAYQTMMDVPKNKMQSVIRRLLRDEEEDDDDEFAMGMAMGDNQEMKYYDNSYNSKDEFTEDPELAMDREEAEGNAQSENQKKSNFNSARAQSSATAAVVEDKPAESSIANSLSSRKASGVYQQKAKMTVRQNLGDMELVKVNSAASFLSTDSSSMEPITDTPLSVASSKLMFVEQGEPLATTPALNAQSARTVEESSRRMQASEQNVGTRKSTQSLLSNEDTSMNRARTDAEEGVSEIHSNTSKNDSPVVEQATPSPPTTVAASASSASGVGMGMGMGMGISGVGSSAAMMMRPDGVTMACSEMVTLPKANESGILPAFTNTLQRGGMSRASLYPMLGYNNSPGMMMSKSYLGNQDDELSSILQTQSQLVLPPLFAGSRNQSLATLPPVAPISTQHTMNDYGCSSVYNSVQYLPPLAHSASSASSSSSSSSASTFFLQNNALMQSQNALLSQMERVSRASTAYDLPAKNEQNGMNGSKSMKQLQEPQKSNLEVKYTLDDEDAEESEKNKQLGLIRNAVEDAAWEEQMEKEIEKHEAAYKQLPNPVTKAIMITTALSTILGVVTIAVTIALVCYYVTDFKPTSANVILSGMRASILFQIQFLLTSILQPVPVLKTDQRIFFPRSYNPVMYNSSHCSGDPSVARDMLVPMSKYFEAVHLDCHFGDSDYTQSNDYTYDTVSVTRMDTEINHQMLFQAAQCYLADSDDCSQVDPMRIYGVQGNIYGLTTLLARMRINLERISKMDVENITFETGEARFVLNALRNDIVAGINKMTNMILTQGKTEVQESITILTIVIVVFCLLFIISMFGNGMVWIKEISFMENVSGKLYDLLPIKEGEKEIVMMSSMITGHDSFDKGREAILDNAQQLLTSVNQNEHEDAVTSAFHQLTSTAAFAVEAEVDVDWRSASFEE
ncbi:uncharacterized protein MONOS_12628 [Monocercomonoides exilis]|uniref:uncharacterized protein n=1 Tax=Monocercomonoides exilis TaxID=2049356 RepID=UPI00355A04D6|nr:hypothetical protein MONOS_12628 [Monocercomonoides exilis]|eukprot:MONOS_12628.1-p1 / transcript=MONOS_12628.1 / gene=MONOS_12628 / organism=Monocercomonoides_exilis_PA203 / gene_product=unspecified product / transcript_product=unspecified product / location=Mono_scaffold00711:2816-8776(+) / protein_length=1898 / sequence_SO=supercontig / SO=protein_coding / is_pseudo=false